MNKFSNFKFPKKGGPGKEPKFERWGGEKEPQLVFSWKIGFDLILHTKVLATSANLGVLNCPY